MRTVIIDNGHGIETKGKCSPDGKLREYRVTRSIAHGVHERLKNMGYNAVLLVPYDVDMSLAVRANRANNIASKTPDAILISIHCNAAGDGTEWKDARGVEAYTTVGKTNADRLAECYYEAVAELMPEVRLRRDTSDGDSDKECDYYILRKTTCPAILTENFFMDNREDVRLLLSDEGISRIVDVHVRAVEKYFNQ